MNLHFTFLSQAARQVITKSQLVMVSVFNVLLTVHPIIITVLVFAKMGFTGPLRMLPVIAVQVRKCLLATVFGLNENQDNLI